MVLKTTLEPTRDAQVSGVGTGAESIAKTRGLIRVFSVFNDDEGFLTLPVHICEILKWPCGCLSCVAFGISWNDNGKAVNLGWGEMRSAMADFFFQKR